jgi:hypothetical protein
MRARLAITAAGPSLRGASGASAGALLDGLVHNERLMVAALCQRDGRTEVSSSGLPPNLGCAALPSEAREAVEEGWDRTVSTFPSSTPRSPRWIEASSISSTPELARSSRSGRAQGRRRCPHPGERGLSIPP